MSSAPAIADYEFDLPSNEELQTRRRRLFTYSPEALAIGQDIEKIFVKDPAFADALQAVDRCFQLARTLSTPNGILLAGPTGSGKTSLLSYVQQTVPPSSLFQTGLGTLSIRLPYRPVIGQVVSTILRRMHYPFADVTSRSVYLKRELAFDLLREKGVRIVLVDEGHHLESQIRYRDRHGHDTAISELLREMMDEVGICIVIVMDGPLDMLERLDPALASRVSVRLSLDNFARSRVWHAFVKAFFRQTEGKGIDFSSLAEPTEADRLHAATDGNRRAFKRLVTEAALVAFDAKKTIIDDEALTTAFGRVYGKGHAKLNPYEPAA